MHGLKKNKKIWIMVLILLLIIVSSLIFLFKKPTNKTKSNGLDTNERFNKKEQKIVDAVYKKIDSSDYFDNSNLKLIELESLQLYGYYKSQSNILYIKVNYNSKCNDGTYSCDNLAKDKSYSLSNNIPFYFFIKVDTNNYNHLEIVDGISANINSDWVSDSSKIE